jgi:hypothetical protein
MLRLETPSSGLTVDTATRCLVAPECFACCAAAGKQTANNPSARTSAPLDIAELKTKSQQTPAKILRKRRNSLNRYIDSLCKRLNIFNPLNDVTIQRFNDLTI